MPVADDLRALLRSAHEAIQDGEAVEAERRAKAISAVVRAERDVAEFLAAEDERNPVRDSQSLRAEFRSRVARIVAAELAGASDEELGRMAGEPT